MRLRDPQSGATVITESVKAAAALRSLGYEEVKTTSSAPGRKAAAKKSSATETKPETDELI